MKKQSVIAALLFVVSIASFSACNKKEQPKPDEQELITTMKLRITDGSGFSQTFTYKVENGFGSTTAGTVQIDTIKLAPGKIYTVTSELYNDKAAPAANLTSEVLDENEAHLFLFQSTPGSGAGSVSFSNGSKDNNGKPFNQVITFTTGAAGSGAIQVNLMHAPTDKNGATPSASGGETDVEAVYPLIIK